MSDEAPSKTRRKKAMHELQDLGEALVRLSSDQLRGLDLPERLHDAVVEVRGITKHEARRRQMQFIGKLMRDVDPEPIRQRIGELETTSHAEIARFQAMETWRDRLLREPDALTEFLGLHPHADAAQLRRLIRAAEEERAAGRPPRSFRELFRFLRDTTAGAGR